MKILSLPTCFSYWLTCISGRFGWCFQGMPAGLLGWDKVGWMVGGENDGGDEGTDNSTWSTTELGVWQGIRLRSIGARGLLSEVSLPFCEGPFKWVYMIRSHFVKTIFFILENVIHIYNELLSPSRSILLLFHFPLTTSHSLNFILFFEIFETLVNPIMIAPVYIYVRPSAGTWETYWVDLLTRKKRQIFI